MGEKNQNPMTSDDEIDLETRNEFLAQNDLQEALEEWKGGNVAK